jgi:hypothetical protein
MYLNKIKLLINKRLLIYASTQDCTKHLKYTFQVFFRKTSHNYAFYWLNKLFLAKSISIQEVSFSKKGIIFTV